MTLSNKVAIISDLHIGVKQNSEKWLQKSLDFVKWFKEELLKQNIEDIIFAGDFFHDRTEVNLLTIEYSSKILEELKDFTIWMIPGNHDCYYKDNSKVTSVSVFKGYKNIHVFDNPLYIKSGNDIIGFIPWGTPISQIENCDIVVGHFELSGFKTNAYKICENGEDYKEFKDGVKLVITGHFHTKQSLKTKSGSIEYVGTSYQMDFNDIGEKKGYHILDISSKELKFEEYTNSIKHVYIYTDIFNNIKDGGFVSDVVVPDIKNSVIKVVVNSKVTPEQIQNLVSKIQLQQPFAFNGVEYLYQEDIKITDQQSTVLIETIIEQFIKDLKLENSEDVYKLVMELYNKYKK